MIEWSFSTAVSDCGTAHWTYTARQTRGLGTWSDPVIRSAVATCDQSGDQSGDDHSGEKKVYPDFESIPEARIRSAPGNTARRAHDHDITAMEDQMKPGRMLARTWTGDGDGCGSHRISGTHICPSVLESF